jgi:hypothetical protein
MEMSISSLSDIFFKHLSKYFMYLTNKLRENVKSRFSFLLSSITWIIMESLNLKFSRSNICKGLVPASLLAQVDAPGRVAI